MAGSGVWGMGAACSVRVFSSGVRHATENMAVLSVAEAKQRVHGWWISSASRIIRQREKEAIAAVEAARMGAVTREASPPPPPPRPHRRKGSRREGCRMKPRRRG